MSQVVKQKPQHKYDIPSFQWLARSSSVIPTTVGLRQCLTGLAIHVSVGWLSSELWSSVSLCLINAEIKSLQQTPKSQSAPRHCDVSSTQALGSNMQAAIPPKIRTNIQSFKSIILEKFLYVLTLLLDFFCSSVQDNCIQ